MMLVHCHERAWRVIMNVFKFWGHGKEKHPRRPRRVRLSLEALEDRTVLSGNAIVAENQLPGTPAWGVSGAGDASIQGFATDVSVNHGQTINFKVNDTAAAPYHIDIYRLGYY